MPLRSVTGEMTQVTTPMGGTPRRTVPLEGAHGGEFLLYRGAQPRFIASGTFLAGTRKIEGKWLFSDMFGGSSSPLSMDYYYYR